MNPGKHGSSSNWAPWARRAGGFSGDKVRQHLADTGRWKPFPQRGVCKNNCALNVLVNSVTKLGSIPIARVIDVSCEFIFICLYKHTFHTLSLKFFYILYIILVQWHKIVAQTMACVHLVHLFSQSLSISPRNQKIWIPQSRIQWGGFSNKAQDVNGLITGFFSLQTKNTWLALPS